MSDEERKKKEQEEFDKLFDDLFKTNPPNEDKPKENKDDILDDDFLKSLFDEDDKKNDFSNHKEDKIEDKPTEKKDDDNFDWLKELIDEIDKEEQAKKKQEGTTAIAPVAGPAKPVKPSFTSKLKDKPRPPKPPEHIRMWGSGKKVVKMPVREESSGISNNNSSKLRYWLIISLVVIISGSTGFFASHYTGKDIKTEVCKNTDIILKNTYTGDKILIDTSVISENGKRIIDQGYIDAHISNLMYNLVKPGEKVIDVGAGFGYHTLYLARIVGNNGNVYSFEARKCVSELLESSIKINRFKNVEIFNTVLFSENIRMIVDTIDHKKRSNFGVHNIILQQDNTYNNTEGEIVNAMTLDSVLQNVSNISLININANGNELSIILGAKNLIANSPNIKIITTWSKYEMAKYVNVQIIVQQMLSNGFKFWMIKPSSGKLVELSRIEDIMQLERGRFLIAKSIN